MTDSGPSSPAAIPAPAPVTGPAGDSPTTAAVSALPAPATAPDTAPAAALGTAPAAAPPGRPPGAAAELTRRQRAGLLLTLILGSLTALPALSMDLYLPALPELGSDLSSPAAQVQLTLTACLLGLALGQFLVGPMSDRFGRRRPLLVGMCGYVLASVACAFAPTIEALTAFRVVQGLAGAAGIVIARAVVRDMFDGLEMARFLSTLLLVAGAAPVLAPVLGGQVLRFSDWRGIFLILAGMGLVLTLITLRWLPETLAPAHRQAGGVRVALRTMRGLLRDRSFTGYLLAGSFGYATLFAYVAASPFVVQEIYGASPQLFSLLFMVNSVGLVVMSQVNGKLLVGRVRLDAVLGGGLAVVGLAAFSLLLMTAGVFGPVGLAPVAAGLFVLMSAIALVLPNANSLGLMRAGHAAGTASALLGTSQFLIAAIASPLVGIVGEHTAVPMATVQLTCVVLAVTCYLGLCRPWRPRG